MLKILIVDDSAIVRKELRHVLELAGTVSVVGEAVDGWDALRQAKKFSPDIVLMDLEMPNLDGFEATRQIKTLRLAQKVIVFTVYADSVNRKNALEAGADAFVIKGADLRTLLDLFNQLTQSDERKIL